MRDFSDSKCEKAQDSCENDDDDDFRSSAKLGEQQRTQTMAATRWSRLVAKIANHTLKTRKEGTAYLSPASQELYGLQVHR